MPFNTERAAGPQAAPVNRLIADIPKGERAVLRVALSSFQGRELINLRVWYNASNGKRRPTKAGVTLKVTALPELHAAIATAVEIARAKGLLP